MKNKTMYFMTVFGVFLVGFLFSLTNPGHALAENARPRLVEIVNLPLSIMGVVSVENLPLDETANNLRTTSPRDNLRDGKGSLNLGSNRELPIPEGVVLTDFVLDYVDGDNCWIGLYSQDNEFFDFLFNLRPSADDTRIEMHFESGISSTAEREIGFFMNSDCQARVFWTGYEN